MLETESYGKGTEQDSSGSPRRPPAHRTSLQHLWAELSEKLSDVVGPEIKYGKGDETILDILRSTSNLIAKDELLETLVADSPELQKMLISSRQQFMNDIQKAMSLLKEVRKNNAISD